MGVVLGEFRVLPDRLPRNDDMKVRRLRAAAGGGKGVTAFRSLPISPVPFPHTMHRSRQDFALAPVISLQEHKRVLRGNCGVRRLFVVPADMVTMVSPTGERVFVSGPGAKAVTYCPRWSPGYAPSESDARYQYKRAEIIEWHELYP